MKTFKIDCFQAMVHAQTEGVFFIEPAQPINRREVIAMLKGISPLISPELLKVLCEMGHGDEICLADANFPTQSMGHIAVRADGIPVAALLDAILPLFPLDQYDRSNFVLMQVVPGDDYKPVIWEEYKEVLGRHEPQGKAEHMERFAYYERAKKAYAIVATGEKALYANIILKKGVVL
jgi:L-fucose mutarotase